MVRAALSASVRYLVLNLEALAWKPCSPIKVERGGVGGEHLGTEHGFDGIAGINADLSRQSANRSFESPGGTGGTHRSHHRDRGPVREDGGLDERRPISNELRQVAKALQPWIQL